MCFVCLLLFILFQSATSLHIFLLFPDINCIRSNGVTLLSALVIPPPEYTAQPVFEDAVGPSYSPADCAMRPNEGPSGQPHRSSFAMYVQHFNKCGVRVQQGSDGKVRVFFIVLSL